MKSRFLLGPVLAIAMAALWSCSNSSGTAAPSSNLKDTTSDSPVASPEPSPEPSPGPASEPAAACDAEVIEYVTTLEKIRSEGFDAYASAKQVPAREHFRTAYLKLSQAQSLARAATSLYGSLVCEIPATETVAARTIRISQIVKETDEAVQAPVALILKNRLN